jgi:predicted porin
MKRLLLTTVSVFGVCAIVIPGPARAQTAVPNIDQIDAEIKELQAQVAALKAQQYHDHQAMLRSQEQAKIAAQDEAAARAADEAKLAAVASAPPPPPVRVASAPPPSGFEMGLGVKLGSPANPKPIVGGIPILVTPGGAFFIAGTLDEGLRYDTGAGHSVLSVQSGLMRASRLTLEGYQDIGFGLRVVGLVEGGLNLSQGLGTSSPSAAGSGFDFGRESYVGVGNDKYGYVDFGRQYAPIWPAVASPTADPFGANYLGGIAALNPTVALNSRVSNSIVYNYNYTWEGMVDPAPRLGFGFAAMYAPPGNHGSATSVDAGQQFGAMASYGTKTWFIDAGFDQLDGINTADGEAPFSPTYFPPVSSDKTALNEFAVSASYVLPFARVFAQYTKETDGRKNAAEGALGIDQYDWSLGAVIPTLPHQNMRLYVGKFYNQTTQNNNFTLFQGSYEYDLVKVPGSAVYLEGSYLANSPTGSNSILGSLNNGGSGYGAVVPTQESANGTTLLKGGTSATIAAGIRYIF